MSSQEFKGVIDKSVISTIRLRTAERVQAFMGRVTPKQMAETVGVTEVTMRTWIRRSTTNDKVYAKSSIPKIISLLKIQPTTIDKIIAQKPKVERFPADVRTMNATNFHTLRIAVGVIHGIDHKRVPDEVIALEVGMSTSTVRRWREHRFSDRFCVEIKNAYYPKIKAVIDRASSMNRAVAMAMDNDVAMTKDNDVAVATRLLGLDPLAELKKPEYWANFSSSEVKAVTDAMAKGKKLVEINSIKEQINNLKCQLDALQGSIG